MNNCYCSNINVNEGEEAVVPEEPRKPQRENQTQPFIDLFCQKKKTKNSQRQAVCFVLFKIQTPKIFSLLFIRKEKTLTLEMLERTVWLKQMSINQ